MSNKILPADVLESVLKLPHTPKLCSSTGPLEAAQNILRQRKPHATVTRVIFYRYDGDGRGRDMCDMVQAGIAQGDLPFHETCSKLNAEVQLIELGAGVPTPEDNARAASFGMMAAEEDTGLLIVSAFGAEAANRKSTPDFFEMTMPDTSALFGAMVSGARAGIPVIAEGLKAFEAAIALYNLRPDLAAHVFICGVPTSLQDNRFYIFADDAADHPGYAAVSLAALMLTPPGKTEAA